MYEATLEEQATSRLREARKLGSLAALAEGEAILDQAVTQRVSEAWRARIFELAEALFQSARMQLSVERYKAIAVGRGANLDTVDMPLNSRLWLKQQFSEIRQLAQESERLSRIEALLDRTNPGPGGFYDDLGNVSQQPHLVRGAGFEKDPAFLQSSLMSFSYMPAGPVQWWTYAESLNDAPLEMRYTGLDSTARYKIRVTYAGDALSAQIRLVADESLEVHPLIRKESPVRPVEFDIPAEATADGELRLNWYRQPGLGGNGRGCQVAEVWLMRKE